MSLKELGKSAYAFDRYSPVSALILLVYLLEDFGSRGSTHKVEAVNVRLIHPSLQLIHHLRRRANHDRAISTDGNVLRNRMLGPLGVLGGELGVAFNCRSGAI